jgi:hypothetical protein
MEASLLGKLLRQCGTKVNKISRIHSRKWVEILATFFHFETIVCNMQKSFLIKLIQFYCYVLFSLTLLLLDAVSYFIIHCCTVKLRHSINCKRYKLYASVIIFCEKKARKIEIEQILKLF